MQDIGQAISRLHLSIGHYCSRFDKLNNIHAHGDMIRRKIGGQAA
jgi:hypothetical protein